MPPTEIRTFRRSDRDQLTALVNAHVESVLPGVTLSTQAVLSQLEREPYEYVVDPWVTSRETLVAVRDDRLVAAAHLLRYADDARVAPDYRGAGELRWLLHWPGADPSQAAALAADADRLATAAIDHLADVGGPVYADGAVPGPAGCGVPDLWPHVEGVLLRAGFARGDHTEVLLCADVADLPRHGAPPLAGLSARARLGGHAVRHEAVLDGRVVGFVEVEADLTVGGTLSRLAGWADVWELRVEPDLRRHGIGRWLLGAAAVRLRTGRAQRLLGWAEPGDDTHAFLLVNGFVELTRTARSWTLRRDGAPGRAVDRWSDQAPASGIDR